MNSVEVASENYSKLRMSFAIHLQATRVGFASMIMEFLREIQIFNHLFELFYVTVLVHT